MDPKPIRFVAAADRCVVAQPEPLFRGDDFFGQSLPGVRPHGAPGPMRRPWRSGETRDYLMENDSGAEAGLGAAIETGVPVHDVPAVVSVALKPLNTPPAGSPLASKPLLMFV
jgi:hypothetical protein